MSFRERVDGLMPLQLIAGGGLPGAGKLVAAREIAAHLHHAYICLEKQGTPDDLYQQIHDLFPESSTAMLDNEQIC
jgi:hypothetical protein